MFSAPPNSCASAFDAALPGTLPRINPECVRLAVKAGLALRGSINLRSEFDRKHYFYCDLPLGYQITQQRIPIVQDAEIFGVGISRIQLEQDSAKNVYDLDPMATYVDLNRAGTALLEVVTKPEIQSPEQAGEVVRRLQNVLQHIGASDGNMSEGSLRCDVNVSVHRKKQDGSLEPSQRVEVKNLNSVKAIEKAIVYEIQRQEDMIRDGIPIERETRTYIVKSGTTVRMRSKEDMLDYRFMPDPDLPPLILTEQMVYEIKHSLPELPHEILERLKKTCGLDHDQADRVAGDLQLTQFYDQLIDQLGTNATMEIKRKAFVWVVNDVLGRLNARDLKLSDSPVSPGRLAKLIELVVADKISLKVGKKVLIKMMDGDRDEPENIVQRESLWQISDREILQARCELIIATEAVQNLLKTSQGDPKKMKRVGNEVMVLVLGEFNHLANPLIVKEILDQLFEKRK